MVKLRNPNLSAYKEQLAEILISALEHCQPGDKKKKNIINSRPQTQKCPKAANKTEERRETRGTGAV